MNAFRRAPERTHMRINESAPRIIELLRQSFTGGLCFRGFENKHAQRGQVEVEGTGLVVPGPGPGSNAALQAHV